MSMTNFPAPSSAAPMTPSLNRFGVVLFSSDRPDLTGQSLQAVYPPHNRSVELWSRQQLLLYTMADAALTYETSQREVKRTPSWAIVLAVIGVFIFLLGLLFLLVKET